jgi:hypothetical protein
MCAARRGFHISWPKRLDAALANRLLIAAGMGKPTRNELLAEYYLRAAGVAAVWIDAEGHVGAQDVASIENEPGRIVYCCERGSHFVLAYRLYEWKKAVIVDAQAIAAKLEELADRGGVGLTPHQIAVDRALEAVAAVNGAIERMSASGDLRDLNQAFKEARKADPSVRYVEYLEARKAAMLEAMAREATQ